MPNPIIKPTAILDRLQIAVNRQKGVRLTPEECFTILNYINNQPEIKIHYGFMFENVIRDTWRMILFDQDKWGTSVMVDLDCYNNMWDESIELVRNILSETDNFYWYCITDDKQLDQFDLNELPNEPIAELEEYYLEGKGIF